jgi:hypothetical protein
VTVEFCTPFGDSLPRGFVDGIHRLIEGSLDSSFDQETLDLVAVLPPRKLKLPIQRVNTLFAFPPIADALDEDLAEDSNEAPGMVPSVRVEESVAGAVRSKDPNGLSHVSLSPVVDVSLQ